MPRAAPLVWLTLASMCLACGPMGEGLEAPGEEVSDIPAESPLGASCAQTLRIVGVAASGEDPPTPARNAIDGSWATRWSSRGLGQFITADLGQTRQLCAVGVAWYNGINGRVNNFVISTSTDNVQFTQVFSGKSSGSTLATEIVAFSSTVNARYVRITVNGNTINTWASITELVMAGPSDTTPPQTELTASGPLHANVQTSTSASLSFVSNEANSRFECRLNQSAWAACSSPVQYSALPLGVYTFDVRAIDAAGNVDASPAQRIWTIVSTIAGRVKPGPENTGVPEGTVLTRHDGDLVITTAGQVVDALDIHGFVQVKAPNVKITRCIIRGGYSDDRTTTTGKALVYNYTPTASFVIEDSELIPDYPSIWLDGIRGLNFTARRVEIQNTTDGIGINGIGATNAVNVRVESNWIHDMRHVVGTPPGYQSDNQTHNDGIQYHYGNNARIIGNRIEGAHNAAVMVSQTGEGTWDLEIRDNWLDGGACSVNLTHNPNSFTQLPPPGKSPGVVMAGNQFGASSACAIYKTPPVILSLSNNVLEASLAPVSVVVNNK